MDLTSQILREVEFRDRLRGYDTDEVDEFLEKVAVAVDDLHAELRALTERVDKAERAASERGPGEDEDSIRRTLVLAQRTADLAIREAQEQAAQLIDVARAEAESLTGDARATAERVAGEAERRLRDEVGRGESERDRVRGELAALSLLLDKERARLKEALTAALGMVEHTFAYSGELAATKGAESPTAREGPLPAVDGDVDDLEAQINEDAASAAPMAAPSSPAPDSYERPSDDGAGDGDGPPAYILDDELFDAADDGEGDEAEMPGTGRATLTALPPLDGAETALPGIRTDEVAIVEVTSRDAPAVDSGSWRLGAGRADWTA